MNPLKISSVVVKNTQDKVEYSRSSMILAMNRKLPTWKGVLSMSTMPELLALAKASFLENETELAYVMGAYKCDLLESACVQSGLLIATDKRLLFFTHRGLHQYIHEYPYSTISSLEIVPSLTGFVISFYASRTFVQFQWINQGDIDRLIHVIREKAGVHPGKQATADDVELIIKLAELKEAGILTQEEFHLKKSMVLELAESDQHPKTINHSK
jgi:hypothetical protein